MSAARAMAQASVNRWLWGLAIVGVVLAVGPSVMRAMGYKFKRAGGAYPDGSDELRF